MKKNIFLIYLISVSLSAQNYQTRLADKQYEKANYDRAIELYQKYYKWHSSDIYVVKRLADSHYFTSKFDLALPYYEQIIAKEKYANDQTYIFRYAQTLLALGEETKAKEWLAKLEQNNSNEVFSSDVRKLEQIKKEGDRFDIESAAFNTENSDFGVTWHQDNILFASPNKKAGIFNKTYKWNHQPYLDLYQTKVLYSGKADSVVIPLPGKVNTAKYHEACIAISSDGSTMYFTKSNVNLSNKKKIIDSKKINHVGLYKATKNGDQWTNIKALPFNGKNYSVMHPFLDEKTNRLYFSSDMSGTIGSFDIFYVEIKGSNSYSEPVNLGETINTPNREQFPFISEDGYLYFSSDGHYGFGLLDVFRSKITTSSSYTKPLNIGLPINTNADDFAFIIKGKNGFFSSNREGGKGDDDIYSFLQTKPIDEFIYELNGLVKDQKTDQLINSTTISIFDQNNHLVETLQTGSFDIVLPPGTYTVKAQNEDYIKNSHTVTILDNGIRENSIQILLTPKPKKDISADDKGPKVIESDGELQFEIPEVLFDLDKYNIRKDAQKYLNDLAEKLKRHPEIIIEIQSHTDIRGSKSYNQKLSNKRAEATKDYLIKLGISSERLHFKGYGESAPRVDCNTHKCSEQEHQKNRRSVFKIIRK